MTLTKSKLAESISGVLGTDEGIKILVFSDVHVYHRQIPNEGILRSCNQMLDEGIRRGVKLIIISGDFWDRNVGLNTPEYSDTKAWIFNFLKRCAKYDITVRILEGTPSHDGKQSKLFEEVNEQSNFGVDIRHVKGIEIERLDRFGLDILYVPDEISPSEEQTYKMVTDLMLRRGLEMVDITVTHGNYDVLIPAHLTHSAHRLDDYKRITRYAIFNGHIHTPWYRGIFHNVGSLCRTAHNEEEDKGGLLFEMIPDGNRGYTTKTTRIINKHAVLFKTINICGLTDEEAMEKIKPWLESDEGSRLRLHYEQESNGVAILGTLSKEYPQFRWGSKVEKKVRKLSDAIVTLETKFAGVELNKDSIIPLLKKQLEDNGHDAETIEKLMTRVAPIV